MMEKSDDNDIKIARYVDCKMSPAEEEAFMQEMGHDDELRKQYEEELLMRVWLEREGVVDEGQQLLRPADEHLDMVEGVLRDGGASDFRYALMGAAAVVVVITGLIFMLSAREGSSGVSAGATGLVAGSVDSSARQRPEAGAVATTIAADSIFARYYTPYSRTPDDPVQVSLYYLYYKQGRYKELLAATDASIREMGSDDREAVSGQYLYLYKGLAYLAMDKPGQAIGQFDAVTRLAGATDRPYYEAEWYGALARLKNKAVGQAAGIARHIMQTASPYRDKAAEMLQVLR